MQGESQRRQVRRYKSKQKNKPYSKAVIQDPCRAFRPAFQSSRELIYTLRKMYGLPLQTHTTLLPWGYDKLIEVEVYDEEDKQERTVKVALPNDDALKLLVQGKYLLQNTSLRKVGIWLAEALTLTDYDFSYVRGFNKEKGISIASIDRLYKLYTPEDVCVLPLEERYEAYRLRLQSTDFDTRLIERARQVPGNYTYEGGDTESRTTNNTAQSNREEG
jgi:hypothetical protein